MNNEIDGITRMIPYGVMLHSFATQSFIGKNDIKALLRSRGVFSFENEKQDTIPLLVSTLLTPDEFDILFECQNTKEDNPKVITRTLEWSSENTLVDSLPGILEINKILNLEFSNYSVVGSPDFTIVNSDPNHIKLEFEIERIDKSKSWSTSRSTFPGSLEVSIQPPSLTGRIAI